MKYEWIIKTLLLASIALVFHNCFLQEEDSSNSANRKFPLFKFPEYELFSFHSGLAQIKYKNKYGFIDTKGEVVIPINFDYVGGLNEGFVWACKGVSKSEKKCGFYSRFGKELCPLIYDEAWYFEDGLACVQKNGLWGYIDTTGKEIIPCKFSSISPFKEKKAVITDFGSWGFIDKKGLIINPEQFTQALQFNEGMAPVKLGGKWGFVDTTGNIAIELKYDLVEHFYLGYSSVNKGYTGYRYGKKRNEGKWGLIDKNGKEIIPIKYDAVVQSEEGFIRAGNYNQRSGIDWIVFNNQGIKIVSRKYYKLSNYYDGLAFANENGKYGFIDTLGNTKIKFMYDNARYFQEGKACVQKDGKWGFVDINGNEVIPLVYNWCSDFYKGLAAVNKDEKWGIIDKFGVYTTPPKYDYIAGLESSGGEPHRLQLEYGLIPVRLDNKWGYLNDKGVEVISCDFEDAFFFYSDTTMIRKDSIWGWINKFGEYRLYDGMY